jgi:hypothetical protein
MVKFSKAYQHDQCSFDIIFQGAETYEEVLEKKGILKTIKKGKNY